MLLAGQDEDRQFRNPGGLQVCGLHADLPLFFGKMKYKYRDDEVPKLFETASIDDNDVSDRAGTGRNGVHPKHNKWWSFEQR